MRGKRLCSFVESPVGSFEDWVENPEVTTGIRLSTMKAATYWKMK
jgi:hypothetical protein